jgi:hypothetical protein
MSTEFIAQDFFFEYKNDMRLVIPLLFSLPLQAMLIGNPAQPALQTASIFNARAICCSFRASYLDDWIYQQRFQDEFKLEGVTHTRTNMQLSTYASQLTFNIENRLDLYGLVGSSRLQIDDEIFTKRAVSWGVGGKLIVLREGPFFFSADAKYFQTNQKPRYFVVEGLPYNITSNYRLQYHDIQVAVGMAYNISICSPYLNATYILTKIEPSPSIVLVRLPDTPEEVDVVSKSVICKKRWGMAIGLTLVDKERATLAAEWRLFNQNAIDWNFEFRF